MTYLDYIKSIPAYQEGGLLSETSVNLLKDMTPFLGTYRAFQRAKEDPRFGTYADLGLSAVGDVATLFGVGAAIKGISAANKARKLYKAADAANDAYKTYSNAAKAQKGIQAAEAAKIRRGNQTIESLSLMDRSPKVESEIIKRVKARDAAREGLRNSKAAYNEAWDQARRAQNAAWKNERLAGDLSSVVNDSKSGSALGIIGGFGLQSMPDYTPSALERYSNSEINN